MVECSADVLEDLRGLIYKSLS